MSAVQPQSTIQESLGWVGYTFYRTESTAAAMPEALLDWRPADPSGAFQFSLAELVMHMADARRMFISQLTGADPVPEYWAPEYWRPGAVDDEIYVFRAHPGAHELLEDLKAAREPLKPFLSEPTSSLLTSPPGARATFERMVAEYEAAGQDVAPFKDLGLPALYHVLFMLCVHESGHRGTLHTLLRMQGANPPEA